MAKVHPAIGGIYVAISYALAQFSAVQLRAKDDPLTQSQRSTANKVFQWVLPWWHNSWAFIKGQQRPWYEKAAALVLPNIYTAYRVAKQSGEGISFPEIFALCIDSTGFSLASAMTAYQASRAEVHFPAKQIGMAFRSSAMGALPPMWRQSMANGSPVRLQQTMVWTYQPQSPTFTQLSPFKN